MCIRDRDEALENTWGAGLYFIRAAALFKLGKRKEALRNMEEALEEGYEEHAVFFKYLPDYRTCLLYTSDAADERSSVDLGGRRIIKKKKIKEKKKKKKK